jgi:hypothetical protein
MEAKLLVVVGEGHVELVCPVDPAAIDDHHHLFAELAERRHDLMNVVAELLRIKVGHNFIKDFGGPILDRPNDTEQHPVGDATPGAILQPRLPFQRLLAFDLTPAQRADGEARALGGAPPARAEQGKAPQDGFVFIEQNDLAAARLVLQGGEFKSTIREVSGVGIEAPGRAIVA